MSRAASEVDSSGSGAKRLAALLLEAQEASGGALSLERFLAEALYHPECGYYTARIRDVGARGDFSTLATLGDSLARAIADWIAAGRTRDVIEVGPGNGQLARDILRHLGWWRRLRVRYHLVDVEGPLRKAQDERLRRFRIHRHSSVRDALRAAAGRALIFSNELPDAFPCRVFERTAAGWMEVHVRFDPGGAREELRPATLPDSTVFAGEHRPGQRVEVHESYRDWLRAWAPEWKSGAMLTIDYGDTPPALYHRRPGGTLRGYALHQRFEGSGIYQAPGRLDLTADVNFSDLEQWGEELGWRTLRHATLDTLLPGGADPRIRAAAGAFRLLEQVPAPGPE